MIDLAREFGVPHPFDAFARRLLQADWESTLSPMRFSASLTLSDLVDAALVHDTRVLMAGLATEQGLPVTATGNLTRALVGRLSDRLTLSAGSRESIRTVCKVVNELDVWPLHLARVVAECAGLLARRNKQFQLTKAGRELLPDEQAGARTGWSGCSVDTAGDLSHRRSRWSGPRAGVTGSGRPVEPRQQVWLGVHPRPLVGALPGTMSKC